MQNIKIAFCGGEADDGIIQYLKSRDIPNAEFISRDKLSEADGNIIVIAYFRNEQEYIDEILQNSHKIIKVYEIMPFSFEGSMAKSIANKVYSALTMVGINVTKVESNEFFKQADKNAPISELFTLIYKSVYNDICNLFIDVDDIKENMITYTKTHPITEFTGSCAMMMMTVDKFGMTPAMYFVLYDKKLNTDHLSQADKKILLEQRNIFGHNILDIACLSSFEKFKDIIIEFDSEAEYGLLNESENFQEKSGDKKNTTAMVTGGVVIIGGILYSVAKKDPVAIAKLVSKGVNSAGKQLAQIKIGDAFSNSANILSSINEIKSTIPNLTHQQKKDNTTEENSFSRAISNLEYEFNINRQQVIYDIENAQENSTLLEAYKRKIYAIKNAEVHS